MRLGESWELGEEGNTFYDVGDAMEKCELDADDEQSDNFSEDNFEEIGKFFDFPNQKPRRQRYYKERRAKHHVRSNPMPRVEGKTPYLRLVGAHDCVRDKILGKFSHISHQTKFQKKKERVKKNKNTEENDKELVYTKVERKKKYKELKRTLKEA